MMNDWNGKLVVIICSADRLFKQKISFLEIYAWTVIKRQTN